VAVHRLQFPVLLKDTDALLMEAMALAIQHVSEQVHSNGQPLILNQAGALCCHDVSGLKLQVEHITRILHHLDPPGVEQLPGDVTNSLKVLLPVWLILVPDWVQCEGQARHAWKALLAQRDECQVCHPLHSLVQVSPNDHTGPWCIGDDGDQHLNLVLEN
jgi:hypothetical protein